MHIPFRIIAYLGLEVVPLFNGKRIALGDDGNNVDNFRQLLHDNNVDWAERVTGRVDEEKAAVNASVGNVLVSHSSELFSEVGGVLILDVLDDWVPAILVVDLVSVTGSVNDVKAEANAVLGNDCNDQKRVTLELPGAGEKGFPTMRDGMNLSGLSDWFISLETTLGVNKVRSKDRVD
jgi:hypothetical protein